MKKKNFVSMILSVAGGILFAMGMCMCLLPEWNVFNPGVAMGAVGVVILLVMLIVRRKMEGKSAIHFSGRTLGSVLLGIVGALGLGVGMCMTLVWNILIPGMLVGIVGIMLLLCLIPAVKGLR
ncbi:MAG TPA: hypothetical protein IAB23_08725 [Candidatus Scybalocola faecavium]|nr:hypothetical protein [Candidatus Scybalocola faecavium]